MMEQSFGIIPLQKRHHEWHIFIIQMRSGLWGFPKGHPEHHESPQETAERELTEETGLRVIKYLTNISLSEQYTSAKTKNPKTVTYFLAYVDGSLALCPMEIITGYWATLKQVEETMKHSPSKVALIKHIAPLLVQHA